MNKLSIRAVSSRARGSLSCGPKSEAGRQRNSMNALRHGRLSNPAVLPAESPSLAFAETEDCQTNLDSDKANQF